MSMCKYKHCEQPAQWTIVWSCACSLRTKYYCTAHAEHLARTHVRCSQCGKRMEYPGKSTFEYVIDEIPI